LLAQETWQRIAMRINEVEGKTDYSDIANAFAQFFSIPSLDASQVDRVTDDVSAVQPVSYDVREWLISVEDVDCAVRNGVFSYEFRVLCGVRQEGFFHVFCSTFMLMG